VKDDDTIPNPEHKKNGPTLKEMCEVIAESKAFGHRATKHNGWVATPFTVDELLEYSKGGRTSMSSTLAISEIMGWYAAAVDLKEQELYGPDVHIPLKMIRPKPYFMIDDTGMRRGDKPEDLVRAEGPLFAPLKTPKHPRAVQVQSNKPDNSGPLSGDEAEKAVRQDLKNVYGENDF
jgi:hypothetical protein